jgi:Mg2+ and Co2+ transporter CorA
MNFWCVPAHSQTECCCLQIHFQTGPETDNVRNRMNQLKDFIVVTPEWVNYALIDDITDAFAPLIQQIEMEVDSIDDLVLLLRQSEQSDMLRRIGSCRKRVMQLTRLLASKSDVVKALIKRSKDKSLIEFDSTEETKTHHDVFLFLGDIQGIFLSFMQMIIMLLNPPPL